MNRPWPRCRDCGYVIPPEHMGSADHCYDCDPAQLDRGNSVLFIAAPTARGPSGDSESRHTPPAAGQLLAPAIFFRD